MDRERRLVALLKSARLMLYAWKGARKNLGLEDDHDELTILIVDIEMELEPRKESDQ